ncbi:hypothetical protein ACSBR1_018335 [Camellia fascicularis]
MVELSGVHGKRQGQFHGIFNGFCALLSSLLRLSPTVVGVTLHPLGNGAPDVFARIAAFMGQALGDVRLNSVLGGAVFVTCAVVGTLPLCVAEQEVRIDRKCFIRDILSSFQLRCLTMPVWGWIDDGIETEHSSFSCSKLCSIMELPLTVPRRLTIPLVEEESCSKHFFGVLKTVWVLKAERLLICLVFPLDCALGVLAFWCTRSDRPPQKFLLPRVLGGFFYEYHLVLHDCKRACCSVGRIGVILGVNPSILGLTILAWSNSMGDLV